MKNLSILLTVTILLLTASAAVAEPDNLKAFPPAAEGMARFVIQLPHKERGEEDDFKVEIIVGKAILTDGVNHVALGGSLEAKPLEGWGFTYYELEAFGPARSTLIGVPPGTPQVEKFVQADTRLIRYNSRIPVVVYVPKNGEVRYRIWTASKSEEGKQG